MNSVVGVVGASARAAAHSLARAGFTTWAVDLFADRDLARVSPCASCTFGEYPEALPRLAANFPAGPFLYTGGLENYPHIVADLATHRELWGNSPAVLERVRDPWQLFAALTEAGFAAPTVVPRGAPCPTAGRWLRKALRSSAGLSIRDAVAGEPPLESHYFQEFIPGAPMSALFVSDPDEPVWLNRTCLLGVTGQLIGERWLHARPFAYCGNVGPLELSRPTRAALWLASLRLSEATGIRGIWGLDFVLKDENAYPVEVNPRYTAAIEILEHAARFSSLMSHGRVFTATRALWKMKTPRRYETPVAKAIYYAPRTILFPASGPWDADLTGTFDPWRLPAFADIPHTDAIIPAGFPVLTLFEAGSSPPACRERLQFRAAELDSLIAESTP